MSAKEQPTFWSDPEPVDMSRLKLSHPSTVRNSGPILKTLREVLNPGGPKQDRKFRLLDTASGSGLHVANFAPHFPDITFQPSEFDRSMLDSITAYAIDCETKNICAPMYIDVSKSYTQWGCNPNNEPAVYLDEEAGHHIDFKKLYGTFDYVLNINMIHISPLECTEGLFRNASDLLRFDGLLLTYGAYAINGRIEPQSNVDFDRHLRAMDPRFGLRNLENLKELADANNMELNQLYDMPANNKLLVWRKF